jgi:hypothetical protein
MNLQSENQHGIEHGGQSAVFGRWWPDATWVLGDYFVRVDSYSPKARIVRFRRVHEKTIRRMSRLRFERQARPA